MVTIHQALARVKTDVSELLTPDAIHARCRELGHPWRQTLLTPAATVHLWLLQLLAGYTALTHLRHLAGLAVTASALCQARARLPLLLLPALVRQTGQRLGAADAPGARWQGHRLCHVDGTHHRLPDTPELRAYFGQPTGQAAGCGFPVAATLVLTHAASGAILDLLIRPLYTHDQTGVVHLHARLQAGDVLVGDRAFSSYAHLCLLRQRELHGVFRVHQATIVRFRPHRRHAAACPKAQRRGRPTSRWLGRLGPLDQLVEYAKPPDRPGWMSPAQYAALPDTLVVRELRVRVRRPGFRVRQVTLMTTLLDPQHYPAAELAQRFVERWEIEGHLNQLKTTLGAATLRCQSVAGVVKELWAFALVYNLVRQVMVEAAARQQVAVARISFVDALRWLTAAPPAAGPAAPVDLIVNPLRAGRAEPRVVKRRHSKYPVMTQSRAMLRQRLHSQRVAR
jgi:hypothetical protein